MSTGLQRIEEAFTAATEAGNLYEYFDEGGTCFADSLSQLLKSFHLNTLRIKACEEYFDQITNELDELCDTDAEYSEAIEKLNEMLAEHEIDLSYSPTREAVE